MPTVSHQMSTGLVSPDQIRSDFSLAMSEMYRQEVPAYGKLIELVKRINDRVLEADPELKQRLSASDNLERISEERHGAIRLGSAAELQMIARVFAVMGMQPVGYYDLTQANVPVHSTAFRSVDAQSLARSPFRVFTSLLRTELIADPNLREKSEAILADRNIFTDELRRLVDLAEANGGLNAADAAAFIREATYTFKWHQQAAVDKDFYEALKQADPRAADIVCFKGPHINHLTPRTLEIDAIHREMPEHGMESKNVVEGPPPGCPVLLRQTSFKALTEKVMFGELEGAHTARFGEIEQRGAALTPAGRELYDKLLAEVRGQILPAADGSNAQEYMELLARAFARFPTEPDEMRRAGLAYFQYYANDTSRLPAVLEAAAELDDDGRLQALLDQGVVKFIPLVYEDFLPVSAAGIFASNASDKTRVDSFADSSKEEFERALGQAVLCEFELYDEMQRRSIDDLLQA